MRRALALGAIAAWLAVALAVPLVGNDYHVALGINVLMYAVMASAWAIFSGPSRYISLASSAFFGIGAYTAATLYERLPLWTWLGLAPVAGALLALLMGLATLRLQGIYFTIFTFGFSELVRQVVTWLQRNVSGSVGLYVFVDLSQVRIYQALLALTVAVVSFAVLLARSRVGLALRVIGEDESTARHLGLNVTLVKVGVYTVTAALLALTGALVAPRWLYLDPSIAFDPMVSFLPVIIALAGGPSHPLGPLIGAVPLVLLFEAVTSRFPNHFMILLGALLMALVYAMPEGVLRHRPAATRPTVHPGQGSLGPEAALPVAGPSPSLAVPARAGAAPVRLEVRDLTKTYGKLVAVHRVSFDLHEGETLGIVGPNGSGKTTLIDLISGATRPDEGTVTLEGVRISGLPPERVARMGVARTFQLVRIYPSLTVRENILAALHFGRAGAGEAVGSAAGRLLVSVGLDGQADRLAGELPYADQKRVELARALALRPRVLLLDEWLSGLNASEMAQATDLLRSLRRGGMSIILVEHIMSAVLELCDRCVVLNFGEVLIDDRPTAALAHPKVVEAYLGASR